MKEKYREKNHTAAWRRSAGAEPTASEPARSELARSELAREKPAEIRL